MTQNPEWSGRTDSPPPVPGPAPVGPPSAPGPAPEGPPYPYAYPPGPYPGNYPPPPVPYGGYPVPLPPRNGLGTAALVVGVVALVGSFSIAGGIILGIAAVVLGFAGRARAKRGEATNGGVALAGIVVGVVAIIAGLVFIAFWVGLFNQMGAGDYFDCLQDAGQDKAKVQMCSEQFRESVEDRFTVTRTPTP